MGNFAPITIEQYQDLLIRLVATHDNLVAAESAGDRAVAEKLRTGLHRLMERAREVTRDGGA
jgi:hypothetical protein